MSRFLVLLILSLIIISCNKEDDPPDETPGSVDKDFIIGSAGGVVENEGIALRVPAGSFSSPATIELSAETEFPDDFAGNKVTSVFRIEGLPADFSTPVSIRLRYEGTLEHESYLAIGGIDYFMEAESNRTSYSLEEAVDSSGYLIATIPVEISETNSGSGAKKSTSEESLSLIVLGITKMKSHDSQYFTFKHPFLANKENIIKLANHMDAAMDTFHTAGLVDKDKIKTFFSESGKLKVVLDNKPYISGYGWSIRMPERPALNEIPVPASLVIQESLLSMEINVSKSAIESFQDDHIRAIAYLMVYRMLYYLYFGDMLDWYGYGSASYLAGKYAGYEVFNSSDQTDVFMSPMRGMEKGKEAYSGTTWEKSILGGRTNIQNVNHSSGMYPFIKFIFQRYPNDKKLVSRIAFETLKGTSKAPAEGIINAIEEPEHIWWPLFFKKYMTGQLISIPANDFLNTLKVIDQIDFYEEADTTRYNDADMADLSAKLYQVNFKFPDFQSEAKLKFEIGPSSLNLDYVTAMVFGVKDNAFIYLGHSNDLTVTDIKSLRQSGYQSFAVLVVNSANEPPFNESLNVELETRLETGELQFNWVILKIKTRTNFIWNDGGSSEGVFIYGSGDLRSGLMEDDHTFTASWSEPYSNGTTTGTIVIKFDPARFPNYITSFTLQDIIQLSDTYTYKASASNIGLSGYKDATGAYNFYASKENTCNYLNMVDEIFQSGSENYSYSTDKVPICTDKSYIDIRLGYQQEEQK